MVRRTEVSKNSADSAQASASGRINAGWERIVYTIPRGDAQMPDSLRFKTERWRSLASALGRGPDQPIIWESINDDFGWPDVAGQDVFDVQTRKWEKHRLMRDGSLKKGYYFFIPHTVTTAGHGAMIMRHRLVLDKMRRRYGLNQKGARHLRDFGTLFEVLALLKAASDESSCRPAEFFGLANGAVTETAIAVGEQHLFIFPGYDQLRIGCNSERYAPIRSFGFFPLGYEPAPARQ
jgi:hypothetical protein